MLLIWHGNYALSLSEGRANKRPHPNDATQRPSQGIVSGRSLRTKTRAFSHSMTPARKLGNAATVPYVASNKNPTRLRSDRADPDLVRCFLRRHAELGIGVFDMLLTVQRLFEQMKGPLLAADPTKTAGKERAALCAAPIAQHPQKLAHQLLRLMVLRN